MISALEVILRRPKVVLAFMVLTVAAGLFSYLTIPKEARPDIQVPVYFITIPLPGISPEDSQRLLIKPMEEELRGLDGVKELTGIAGQGYGVLVVEFNAETDTDLAARKVRQKVDVAKAKMPGDAEEPVVSEVNMSLFPTIMVTLSGNVPERTLYKHARALKDQIEAIPSVLEANLSGHREEVLEVIIDELKLQAYQISQSELISAVRRNNRLVAAGDIDAGNGRFNIKVPGLFESARDVFSLPVKVSKGTVITLGDIATIKRTFKDARGFSRYNGRPAMSIRVVKRIGENIIETNKRVRAVVLATTRNWPDAMHVNFAFDESVTIFDVIGSLEASIMTAIALVMIICVAALGTRSALLVGLAIPTSFMLGFLIVALLGKTINNMLMFGMVLTVGMLVDGAIVVVEYADRKMAEGLARREAYIMAARRMFWPVTSSTATTLAAFLPMLFWPGVTGKFMSNLPTTVVIVLTASLVTAMVFLPVLGGFFGKANAGDAAALKALSKAEGGDLRDLKGLTGAYARLLSRLVNYPLIVTGLAAAGIIATFIAFKTHNNGVTFFVDTDARQAIVYVRGRGNFSALEKLRLTTKVEKILLNIKGISVVATQTGGRSGAGPKLGSGQGLDQPKDIVGNITIELSPYGTRPNSKVIYRKVRQLTSDLPGIIVEVKPREDGPPTGKAIRLQVRAPGLAAANTTAARIRKHLEKNVTGLTDIEDETPLPGIEWTLKVDREEAGRYGADVVSVGALVQLVTNGVLIGSYRPDDASDEVDIRVRLPRRERAISRLDTMRLQTPNGLVPLKNFVTREVRPAVDSIIRKDGMVSVYVKANTVEGVLADVKVKELERWLKTQSWPKGVQFVFRGADENQKKSQAFLQKAMLASIFIMFLILLVQFNSFYHAILTLSTLVMSIAGVLIGMMVTGQAFSIIMTGTGIVALAGIVVNNAIVLIDTYHVLLREGYSVRDAVVRSAAQRLRPVLLTTVTTIFGLLPMIFQLNVNWFTRAISVGSPTSSWWVQLATTISFGLAFATLLTLLLTPVLLAAPTVWRDMFVRIARWLRPGRNKADGAKSAAGAGDAANDRGFAEAAE